MKNDMKKRILSAQLALILLLMLWCGIYFETKESQRQMEQLEASQSESGASNAVKVKRKLCPLQAIKQTRWMIIMHMEQAR